MNISIEGFNYCKKYKHPINDDLVNGLKPSCITRKNGCGNCDQVDYQVNLNA